MSTWYLSFLVPLHHVRFCFTASRRWMEKENQSPIRIRPVWTSTSYLPSRYLSFSFSVSIGRKNTWFSLYLWSDPIQRGFLFHGKLWLTHVEARQTAWERSRLHDLQRRGNFFFFFFFLTLVLNWFYRLLPSNSYPLWKALFLAQNITKDIFTFCLQDTLIDNSTITSILEKQWL